MNKYKNKVTKTIRFDIDRDKDLIQWWSSQSNQSESIRYILRSIIRENGTGDYFEAQDNLVQVLKAKLAEIANNDVKVADTTNKVTDTPKKTAPAKVVPKKQTASASSSTASSSTNLLGIKL